MLSWTLFHVATMLNLHRIAVLSGEMALGRVATVRLCEKETFRGIEQFLSRPHASQLLQALRPSLDTARYLNNNGK
jgi:hypothetical protein